MIGLNHVCMRIETGENRYIMIIITAAFANPIVDHCCTRHDMRWTTFGYLLHLPQLWFALSSATEGQQFFWQLLVDRNSAEPHWKSTHLPTVLLGFAWSFPTLFSSSRHRRSNHFFKFTIFPLQQPQGQSINRLIDWLSSPQFVFAADYTLRL